MNLAATLLEVQNLTIGIQTLQGIKPTLNDISFTMRQGETVALLGESGSGKTLTALAINQLLPNNMVFFQDSKIKLQDQSLLDLSEVQMQNIRGRQIGMIFQDPMTSLNPVLTIGYQIEEILKLHSNLSNKECYHKVIELLNLVGISDPYSRYYYYPHQLSGGMKQRIMIAMGIAVQPALLIADEPTTALDVTTQAQILSILKKLQIKNQMGILFITHDLGVVKEIAHKIVIMYAGEIVEIANSELFFQKSLHPYSQKLFALLPDLNKKNQPLQTIPGNVPSLTSRKTGCVFATRCHLAWEDCFQIKPRLISKNDNQSVRCLLYDEKFAIQRNLDLPLSPPSKEAAVLADKDTNNLNNFSDKIPILKIENLKVYFSVRKGLFKRKIAEIKAVDDINFSLEKGKTLALVGESGCGKTTLAKAILRLIEPTAGKLFFDNTELLSLSSLAMQALRKDLQIIFQDPYASLNPRKQIIECIAEGIKIQGTYQNKNDLKNEVKSLLAAVGLPMDVLYRYPHEFSGGQRQRISIARALAVKPSIIICDEPTSALDLSVQAQIINLLCHLQKKFNLSFLFISHNISVVSYMADEIAVMYLGKIVEYGPTKNIITAPKHPYTQALLSAVPTLNFESKKQLMHYDLPSLMNPPTGCHFHPRCPFVMPHCKTSYPLPIAINNDHVVSCYLYSFSSNKFS